MEGGRVVGHDGEGAIPGARGELVVGDFAFVQHPVDRRLGPARVGEVILEGRADQLVTRAPGQRLRLFVDVGDDAPWIGRHQGVDIRFDQRSCIELLIADSLIQQHAFCFHLFSGCVVRADQEVSDDCVESVAEGRDRYHRRKTAAILSYVGQLVDVLDAA